MTLTLICQLAEIGTCIATFALAVVAWWQIAQIREQTATSFEDRLTEQYRKLMKDIPTDVWLGADLKTVPKEQQRRCRDAIYRYIDLSNEQAFLHNVGRVRPETWRVWKEGIKSNMDLRAFDEVWKEVAHKTPEAFTFLRELIP